MTMDVHWVLLALLGLQVKHVLADYVLQSGWMLETKGRYGAAGGIAHAGLHGVLTACVLALGGLAYGVVAGIAVVEAVVHYHIDWGKERIVSGKALGTGDGGFWLALGLDQFLHQITYLGIVWAALALS